MRLRHDGEAQAWSLRWGDLLLHIRLLDGTLLGDYFGPAPEATNASLPGNEVFDALTRTRADAGVQLAPDGRGVRWSPRDWDQPDQATFTLTLRADSLPLRAALRFEVDEDTGILLRRTVLEHTGDGPEVRISSAGSMAVLLPADVREVAHLAGRWGAETQVQYTTLSQTALLLESRSGKTGFEFSPYVALLAPRHTYFTQLFWTGNWQYYVRRQPGGRVVLAGGLNPWGFRYTLAAGDKLTLPEVLIGCVEGDLNQATQRLHRYRRRARPLLDRPVPVQFNSWFPYQGAPPVEKMKAYASKASELGCEVFVLDAGWYTTEREDPDQGWWLSTGDWLVNRKLFPGGLEELSAHCREQGMDFGIWMEPEAVGPNAAIRRGHPEWLHCIGGQAAAPGERAILNLGVPEARSWIRERIMSVLTATGARWLKWDFNIDLDQGGWALGLPGEMTRQDPLVAHYRGLYALQDELRAACPGLVLEMCSSGGSRFDAAILSHAHVHWISDQTHPLMKLASHFGTQLANPPEQCNDWLVEWPPHEAQHDPLREANGGEGDLAFRTGVAMLTSFGISAPVELWTGEDAATFSQYVLCYKQHVRPILPLSEQYLLTEAPPLDGNGEWAAVWYVLPEGTKGVLFAFRLANGTPERIFALPGLQAEGPMYRLTSPGGWSVMRSGEELTGGLVVEAASPFRAVLIVVEQVEA